MSKSNQQNQGEIIPRPAKKKFILQNKTGEIVATLIDRKLADSWISTGKKGAVKLTEGVLALVV